MPKASPTFDWEIKETNRIIRRLYRHSGGYLPTWTALQREFEDYKRQTPANPEDQLLPIEERSTKSMMSHIYPSRSRAWYTKRIAEFKDNGGIQAMDADAEWNFETSEDLGLPVDANFTLMELHKFGTTSATADGFSIRQAKWANRLRWFLQTGGSPQGIVTDVFELYKASAIFTARERVSQAYNQPMRTGILQWQYFGSEQSTAVWGESDDNEWQEELRAHFPNAAKAILLQSQISSGEPVELSVVTRGLGDSKEWKDQVEIMAHIMELDPTGALGNNINAHVSNISRMLQDSDRYEEAIGSDEEAIAMMTKIYAYVLNYYNAEGSFKTFYPSVDEVWKYLLDE